MRDLVNQNGHMTWLSNVRQNMHVNEFIKGCNTN